MKPMVQGAACTCTSSSQATCVTARLSRFAYTLLRRPLQALPMRSTVRCSVSTCSPATRARVCISQSEHAEHSCQIQYMQRVPSHMP